MAWDLSKQQLCTTVTTAPLTVELCMDAMYVYIDSTCMEKIDEGTCMYLYIYIYAYEKWNHIHTEHIHFGTHTCIHTCMHACMNAYMRPHVFISIPLFAWLFLGCPCDPRERLKSEAWRARKGSTASVVASILSANVGAPKDWDKQATFKYV